MLVSEYSEYRGSIGVYSEISDDAFPPDGGDQSGQQTDIAVSQVVDFDALRAVNPDIVGWLVSEDEAVNYPIVQTDDNGFYLKHMFDKQKNKTGCPFLDFENAMNFTDGNSVVYGHNMLDGSMFGSLKKNMEQEYFDTHPQMNLYTPAANYSVDIFSVYTANPAESADTKTSPWRLSWDNEAEYMGWLTQIKARSLIESDIEIADGNKVLTLSTCTNGGKSRLLVVGRLKEIS
jgi:SrtB family sortase